MADKVIVMVVIAPEANAKAFLAMEHLMALADKFDIAINTREIDLSTYEASGFPSVDTVIKVALRNRVHQVKQRREMEGKYGPTPE
jgi:hypothetical protein